MFDLDDTDVRHGERLLMRTLRRLALGRPCQTGRGAFEGACGVGGPEAYRTLQVFLQHLSAAGRRRLALSMPWDPRLTADEAEILQVFAAAQADDYRALYHGLMGLLDAPPAASLVATVGAVADTLALNGLLLTLRPPPDAAWAMAAE